MSASRRPRSSFATSRTGSQAQAKALFGYQGQIVSRASEEAEYLVDNPVRRCPDIRKARTELAYDPKILIDEGLRRSLLWYSGNREGSES